MPTTYPIPNGRTVMTATLFTGTGGAQTVVNTDFGTVGFKPDFIWMKNRTIAQNHYSVDTVQGIANVLRENNTQAATTDANFVTSVNLNGFSLGSSGFTSGENIVGWQWQAGQGTNTTNTSGSITSTVSVNQTAGFSVVGFNNPTSGNYTVGHGLGVAPQFIIIKYRSGASNWFVYHASLGYTQRLFLNTTDAAASTSYWTAAPSSTVINFGSAFSDNPSQSLVAYCWAPVAGYSQFGSYTGNGSTDGTFVYTGFRPKFVMIKCTTTSVDDWTILDSTRNTYNPENAILFPNLNVAEATATVDDYLSNGFKLRQTGNGVNGSGQTYIYIAFAENPFKYANAR